LTGAPGRTSRIPAPVTWGAVVGVLTAASPLAFWWLDPSTVYALGLVLIAAVYIGFAVADGRLKVIVAESTAWSLTGLPRPSSPSRSSPG